VKSVFHSSTDFNGFGAHFSFNTGSCLKPVLNGFQLKGFCPTLFVDVPCMNYEAYLIFQYQASCVVLTRHSAPRFRRAVIQQSWCRCSVHPGVSAAAGSGCRRRIAAAVSQVGVCRCLLFPAQPREALAAAAAAALAGSARGRGLAADAHRGRDLLVDFSCTRLGDAAVCSSQRGSRRGQCAAAGRSRRGARGAQRKKLAPPATRPPSRSSTPAVRRPRRFSANGRSAALGRPAAPGGGGAHGGPTGLAGDPPAAVA
jgi:hypothetical protein